MEAIRPVLPALAGFLAFFGVLMAVVGAAAPSRRDPIEERLILATQRSRTLEEIEMQASFNERFFKPLFAGLSKMVSRITPTGVLESAQRQLMVAGLAGRMQVSDFIGIEALSSVIGLGLGFGLGFTPAFSSNVVLFLLVILIFGGLGIMAPILWIRNETSQRKVQIIRQLPDAIDLLSISVEAGLGFDQALARVVSKSDNALTREFARVIQEMRIGIPRRDALRSLVERTGVDDLSAFISAIIQAEQLGASISNVLRIQADEMRVRRRQYAERLAQLAPIKILFPMAFLIFPPIFIVVLGPAIPKIMHAFAPGFPL